MKSHHLFIILSVVSISSCNLIAQKRVTSNITKSISLADFVYIVDMEKQFVLCNRILEEVAFPFKYELETDSSIIVYCLSNGNKNRVVSLGNTSQLYVSDIYRISQKDDDYYILLVTEDITGGYYAIMPNHKNNGVYCTNFFFFDEDMMKITDVSVDTANFCIQFSYIEMNGTASIIQTQLFEKTSTIKFR